jgi:cell division protein FtsL
MIVIYLLFFLKVIWLFYYLYFVQKDHSTFPKLTRLIGVFKKIIVPQSKAYFFNGEVKKINFTITIQNNNMCLVLRPRRFFCIIYI